MGQHQAARLSDLSLPQLSLRSHHLAVRFLRRRISRDQRDAVRWKTIQLLNDITKSPTSTVRYLPCTGWSDCRQMLTRTCSGSFASALVWNGPSLDLVGCEAASHVRSAFAQVQATSIGYVKDNNLNFLLPLFLYAAITKYMGGCVTLECRVGFR
jgi:hypothetical protein